jgi:hypothetical protein
MGRPDVRGYRILDEPSPGRLARLAVNPFFPLLALMMAGAWAGLPWLLFNGLAIGSATRRREALWLLGGLVATAAVVGLLLALDQRGLLARSAVPFLVIAPEICKLVAGYASFELQERSYVLYRYFGGPTQNGVLPLLVLSFVLVRGVDKALVGSHFLSWVLR